MSDTEERPDALPAGLAALIARAGKPDRKPPVERWSPDYCGDIDMLIAADGTWSYLGSPITRAALVRLFASILKVEDGRYVLVTPVEKFGIRVDDAPFVAVEMHAEGEGRDAVLTFRTNVGDVIAAGADHGLRFVVEAETGGVKPYLHVRAGLEALLARPLLYELVEHGQVEVLDGEHWFGVWSGGVFFRVERRQAEERS